MPFSEPTPGWPRYELVMSFMADSQTTPHQVNVQYVMENFSPATISTTEDFFQRLVDHLNSFDPGESGDMSIFARKLSDLISDATPTPEEE